MRSQLLAMFNALVVLTATVLAVTVVQTISQSSVLFAADPQLPNPAVVTDSYTALFALHKADAESYGLFRDSAQQSALSLMADPVYRWSNPTRSGGQVGDVFVWTYRGRPEAIATIFSHPENGRRVLCHEWHSLSPETLRIVRKSKNRWAPKGGLKAIPIVGADAPAETPVKRLVQMRSLARQFAGTAQNLEGERWELRLLPQPLMRFESADQNILDGALFSFVSSAGTDPEIVLIVEAASGESVNGAVPSSRWQFMAGRFSDMNLRLVFQEKEVWSSLRDAENTFERNANETFRFFRDRVVAEVE